MAIEAFRQFPNKLETLVSGLSDDQLRKTYRPNGWTVRQVVHHLADSHLNMVLRLKSCLTEDNYMIKHYDEKAWANLPDIENTSVEVSILMLKTLHERTAILFKSLDESQWKRELLHPMRGPTTVEELCLKYVWHGNHHFAHIELAMKKS